LVQEGVAYRPAPVGLTPLAGWAIAAGAAALLGLVAAGIAFAVVPALDALELPERRRSGYVYGAQVLLAVLFVHVKLPAPWLLGAAGQYWRLIVMAIAFAGVGLSEVFRWRKLQVLAEPLQRTGIFLPLLPLLAFWARPPTVLQEFVQRNAPAVEPFL